MDLRYINSKGGELNLTQWPYMYSSGDLYDFMWDCNLISGTSNRITEFYKSPVEKPIKISITADTREEFAKAVDHLFETVEVDVINLTPGKLYIGDMYIRCYIRGIKKADFNMGVEFMFSELSVLFENQFWITEIKKTFYPVGSVSEHPYLDYDYDYDYDYTPSITQSDYINLEHYAPCNFQLKIYGPAIDPSVTIGGVIRQVYTTLEEGQYLLIDSRDKTVKRVLNDGSVLNEFDNRRRKPKSIFEPIMPGLNEIIWDAVGFDLTLFVERSEPRWR